MKKLLALCLFVILAACNLYRDLPDPVSDTGWKVKELPAYPQQRGGDPQAGFNYLIYGDYIGSGIPFELLEKRMSLQKDTVLRREGVNAKVAYAVNVFEAQNGVPVANGNCLACHASKLNGEVVIGLGNSFSDYRKNLKPMATFMKLGMKLKYGKQSEEWAAYEDFGYYFKAMAPAIRTNQPGVNPAAELAEACVAYRDPVDLTYTGKPQFEVPKYTLASDVPPLWNVKKKNTLYYTAVGRGDFTKLLFQASFLGITDSTAAREAVTHFKDVLAWLESLEPPAYPQAVEAPLAAQGEVLFNEHCAKCHGSYGAEETYPNKVVSLDLIKTDPYYASYAMTAPIVDWYNRSWFATSEPRSYFEPEPGYVAPPLDGVWATAPYLHNGSVPNLETLLNSSRRPTYWRRSGRSDDYNYQTVGWNYTVEEKAKDDWTYDTTIPGYSNSGHYFGDKLRDEERRAVIEYLKTL